MEGFRCIGIRVWCWEKGVYSPGEAGLLILGQLVTKASFSLMNFGPPDLVPIPSQPGRAPVGETLLLQLQDP